MTTTVGVRTRYWGNRRPRTSYLPAPRVIWSYWHDDTPPLSVRMARRSWAIFAPDYEVRMLSRGNVESLLGPVPRRIEKRGHAALSDWVRLEALKRSGGLWMDASILLFAPIEEILPQSGDTNHQPFLYYNRERSTNQDSPMLESWMILAPANCDLVRRWAHEYKIASVARTPYRRLMSAAFRRPILQKYPDISYFTVFGALQVALLKIKTLTPRMADSELGPYMLHHRFGYDSVTISAALMSGDTDGVLAVKLRNGDRPLLDAALAAGRPTSSSPLASLMPD